MNQRPLLSLSFLSSTHAGDAGARLVDVRFVASAHVASAGLLLLVVLAACLLLLPAVSTAEPSPVEIAVSAVAPLLILLPRPPRLLEVLLAFPPSALALRCGGRTRAGRCPPSTAAAPPSCSNKEVGMWSGCAAGLKKAGQR